jgi:hypothetical protein
MENNIKVGLCLHGLFDSTTDSNSLGIHGYEYIRKHILDLYDTDVYIHSWQIDKADMIESIYRPKKAIFEKQIDFTPLINKKQLNILDNYAPPRSPQSVLSHFYSIQKSFEQLYLDPTKNYDVVIKARFDLGQINRTTSPYNVECIKIDLSNLDKINMASWPDNWMISEGPPDMWFYSNFENMKLFSTIYNSIENYMTIGTPFSDNISNRLGIQNISNASVLYKKFFEDNNLWDSRNQINCVKN